MQSDRGAPAEVGKPGAVLRTGVLRCCLSPGSQAPSGLVHGGKLKLLDCSQICSLLHQNFNNFILQDVTRCFALPYKAGKEEHRDHFSPPDMGKCKQRLANYSKHECYNFSMMDYKT